MVAVVARYEKLGEPYIRVRLSDGRVMREHRFLMEQKLGRKLKPNEHVHHKDEQKRNNDPSNFEVKTPSEHARGHHKPAETVRLVCPKCGISFERTLRYVRFKTEAAGQLNFLCSRQCRVGQGVDAVPADAHGTRNGYRYWKCRCDLCRAAQRSYMKAYRK